MGTASGGVRTRQCALDRREAIHIVPPMPQREKVGQIQAVVSAIIEHCVATSLADVERALTRWRSGELGPLDAHGAMLKHAARCERVIERVTAAAAARPVGVLRDALDAGLIDRAEFVALAGEEPEAVEPAHTGAEHEPASPPDRSEEHTS